jgi:large subunit ribosomal protein L5
MQTILEKVTLNIGAGQAGEKLENAKTLLERITGRKPLTTKARARNPTFKIKKGDLIGVKVTLRGKDAEEILKRALDAVDFHMKEKAIDDFGNAAFGIKEYIDFPGAKYDPKLGMLGFDVCITLKKIGKRVSERRIAPRKLPKKQRVSRKEAIEFLKKFNAVVE